MRAERMAAKDPPETEQSALYGSMDLERLDHVVGTARLKPARAAHNWRQHDLVRTHERDQREGRDAREARRDISSITSWHLHLLNAARPMKTHSVRSGIAPPFTSRR